MRFYPRPYTLEETEDWIARSMRSDKEHGFSLWAVALKENGQFLGQCGISLQNIDGERLPEIGYHFHKMFWRRAYASEAALGSLYYGFSKCGLQEIFIHTATLNIPSIRVAEKIGMTKRKIYDKTIGNAKATMRHVVFSIIRASNQAYRARALSRKIEDKNRWSA